MPFSELGTLTGSDFEEWTRPYPGLAGSEFRERTGPNLGLQVRRKDWAQPWLGRFGVRRKASSFLRTSNHGRFRVRRKDSAEPWFSSFGVRRKDRAKPWYCRFWVWTNPNHNPSLNSNPGPFSEFLTYWTKVWPIPFSDLQTCWNRVQPVSLSGPKLQTRVPPRSFSELRTCPTKVRPFPFSQTPNRNSESGFGQVLSLF